MTSCIYDAVFQNEATCYQLSSVPSDTGILEHHQLRMQTIQVNLFPPCILKTMFYGNNTEVFHVQLPRSDYHTTKKPTLCVMLKLF